MADAVLTDELQKCADELGWLIDAAKRRCESSGMSPYEALSTDGTPLLGPLLAARAQVLTALAS